MITRLILLFAFIAVLCPLCFGQQKLKPDSLLNVLKTQKEDTAKVHTLNALSKHFSMEEDYRTSNKYAEEAITLSQKINFKKGFAAAHTIMGINYSNLDNYPEAMKNHMAALKFSEEAGDRTGAATAHLNIGVIHNLQGNNDEALKSYRTAANIYTQSGDKRKLANAYYNIGNIYYSPMAKYEEAIKAHSISLRLSKEIGDKPRVTSRYIDIGNNYESLGNYPEALNNYMAALKLSEELGNKGNMASAYNNIGEIYKNMGNNDQALNYYLAGLKLSQEIKSNYGIAISYNNIGEVYEERGSYEEAMKYHQLAHKMFQEMKWKYYIAGSFNNIGNNYFLQNKYWDALQNHLTALKLFKEVSDDEQITKASISTGKTYFELRKFTEARQSFNEALTLSKKIRAKNLTKECYQNLAKLDSADGNWESAYKNHKLFLLYRDSLLNEENTKKITEATMQFVFAKKEDSLKYQQDLTNEKLKQQTLLTAQQRQMLLLNEKDMSLLNNEKLLQRLQIEKAHSDIAAKQAEQKADAENNQRKLALLNKEKTIQAIELNKQKQLRNYLLAGLFLFALLSFTVYRNYRIRQNLKLQTLRNKIASDLHDDVGSTLSSISIFSQMAQQQSKEAIPLLETIEESSRKMLDAMADIVWAINPENDQFEKIILKMKSFAYELLGAKGIDFEFVADDNLSKVSVPMNIRKNLYLIFKEATNNLVKYARANRALFSIKEEKNNLTMLISDNGKGFDISSQSKGNGLKNMQMRAKEIGARLAINSLPEQGTAIEVMVAI